MDKQCVICKKLTDSESSAVLVLGGFGNPKYICEECEADIDTARLSHFPEEVFSAMERVGEKLTSANIEDEQVLATVNVLFSTASERATMIVAGTYDFANDEHFKDEADFELTDEYKETEEDKELDRKEKEKNAKFDKISSIVCAVLLAAALGFLIYRIISSYLPL